MNKLFFQVKLLLAFSITTILLVLGSCSDSSSSSNDIGGKVVPDIPNIEKLGIENVKITKNNANVEFEFEVPPSADAVRIVARPVSGGANSPLNTILGNVLATTYELDDAKPITVTVPRTDFLVFSDDYVGKVVLKSLRPYTSYSFSISALSGSSESAARVDLPEVSVPVNSASPQDKISSVIVEKASPIKLKWKNGHKDGYQEGIDDFTKVRFYVYDGAKEIASYLVDNPSTGEVSLVVLTNREDSTFYRIKAVYISVNGIESSKKDLISFTPSQLKSNINPVEGLTIAARNIENTADASEALYISWNEYDYSNNKAGTSITVSISVASYVISDITVDKDSVSLPSFVKEVKREGELDIYPSRNAIWINNLYGVKNYTASVVVHDDSGSVSQAVTASASTIDTTTEPVSNVEISKEGNSIIVTWDKASVSDYAGANLKLVDSSKDNTETGYEIKTIQVRGYSVEKAIFSALEAKEDYKVEVIAVDVAGNISSAVVSEDPITIEESDVKKGESPGRPIQDGDPLIYYKANGIEADVFVSWNALASDKDIKDYTVVLNKQEGDDEEAAKAVDKTEVKTITVKDTQVTLTKLQRPTDESFVIYSVSVYATDEFGNSSEGKKDKTLTIPIKLDLVASSLAKESVTVNFANIDGKTPAGLYGAIVNSGVLSIQADVSVPANKTYVLALYNTSDNNNPIAVAIADNSDSDFEETKTVYFTDRIRIPKGTEEADNERVKRLTEGGMTYNAKLFEVFDNFLSTGIELDPITVADTVSTIATGATISDALKNKKLQALVFNTTTGELEVTFTKADLTGSKSPSGEELTDAQVLYRIYATTESITGADHAEKLESIKALDHKSVDVAGDIDPKGSLFGFASDTDTETKKFSVAIETISTLNTAISGAVISVTGVATGKKDQAFKEGAEFKYEGNSGENVYVYSFNDGSKETEVPTGSNIQLPSDVVDNTFALTPFSIEYLRGTRFTVDGSNGDDAVTIHGIPATQESGELNHGAAGKITVNTNVEAVGTGVYRVSLSAEGQKAPYATLSQEVTITISPKDDISNAKPVFDRGTIGKSIIFGEDDEDDATKEATISFSSLPSGKDNLEMYYDIKKFQQQTLIADNDNSLIEFDDEVLVNTKIELTVKKAAADKGPYSLLITPKSNYAKELTGSIKIDFDVSTKKSTAFEYSKNVYHLVKDEPLKTDSIKVTVKTGADHPVDGDKKGTFTVYPELPEGLIFNTDTGAITGRPTQVQDPQKYRVTYTPADLATHAVYSTEIAIFITEEELEMNYVGGASYSYTVDSPIEAVIIEKNSLRDKHIRGRYRIKSGSVDLPKGLSLNADTGAITGTPNTVTSASSVTIEFIPNKDEYPILKKAVTIVVKKAVELSYAPISGRVGVALGTVEPSFFQYRYRGIFAKGRFADTGGLEAATGLDFDTSTGAISGTPDTAVTRKFTVTYTPPKEFQVNYGNTPIEVSISIAKGTLNVNYDIIGGRVDEDLLAASPKLPEGIIGGRFADTGGLEAATGLDFDTSTGAISGIPTKAVARKFTVTYTPPKEFQVNYGNTPIKVSIIIDRRAISVSYGAIEGTVGEDLSAVRPKLPEGITGGRFADTGGLEAATGLDFDTSTGAISGTPDTAVTRKFTVTYTPPKELQATYGDTPIEVSISIAKGTLSVKYDDIRGRVGEDLGTVRPKLPEHIGRVGGTFVDTDNLAGATGLAFNTDTGAISGRPTTAVNTRTFRVTYTLSAEEQANYVNTSIVVEVSITAFASSLGKENVVFANIDGKTPAGLYGAIINSGVLSIQADVTVPAKKKYVLALYNTSDNNNPIAVAMADNSDSDFEEIKTVYFTDRIRIPKGTEEADNERVKRLTEGGMTYNAKLFEVFDNFLSTGIELDPITVADTVSTIATGATISDALKNKKLQALVFNTTTGELEVTFTKADLTGSKSPSGEELTDAQVLYRIYATTESITGADADEQLTSIKALNYKSVDVAGDTDPLKGSLFGFASDSKSFSVAIETISTLNTAISGAVISVTGVATEKTNQAFKEGAEFKYAGNNGENVYVYSFNDGSKETEVPTGSNIQLPSGVVDNTFALTPFSIEYLRGTRFTVDDSSGNDAVIISGIPATQESGNLNHGAAGKITVNTNVEAVGTGVYRVSLSATGEKTPYATLSQEVTITISPKDDISNAKPEFESGTIGKSIIFGEDDEDDATKEATISFSSLPSGKENLGKYYYIEKFQQQTLIADSDVSLIAFAVTGYSSNKITLTVKKAAADEGPYS